MCIITDEKNIVRARSMLPGSEELPEGWHCYFPITGELPDMGTVYRPLATAGTHPTPMKVLGMNIFFLLPDSFQGDLNDALRALIDYREKNGVTVPLNAGSTWKATSLASIWQEFIGAVKVGKRLVGQFSFGNTGTVTPGREVQMPPADDCAVSLADCPPGLFRFGEHYGFKTEYKDQNGPEAYCVPSGEYFWGGATTAEDRARLMVEPCVIEAGQVLWRKPEQA